MDWSGKFFDLLLGALLGAQSAVGVEHWKKRALARLGDHNPFRNISANHDLTRAVRLAWVEAALEILDAAEAQAAFPEWSPERDDILRFASLARAELIAVRSAAFDRRTHPGQTPIDEAVGKIIEGVPEFIGQSDDNKPAGDVTESFSGTLAALTKWPLYEVPAIFEQIASNGLAMSGDGPSRAFGELVFAAFAELIKNPDKYPEAREAFHIAMADMARKLSQSILAAVQGLDDKIDALIAKSDALEVVRRAAADYLAMLPKIADDVVALRQGQELEAERGEARHRETSSHLVRLEALMLASAGGGAASVAAIAKIRDLLRPGNPEIDDFSIEQLPSLVKRIIDDLQKPAAIATDFAGAVKTALLKAQQQTEELNFNDAAHILDEALIKADSDDRDRARGRAALLAERGRVARLQIRYLEAADFNERAAQATAFDHDLAQTYSLASASDHYAQGVEFGDNVALIKAILIYRRAAENIARDRVPLDWAMTQNNLGSALQTLGERETGTARLEEAVAAYRAALEEYTREWTPYQHEIVQRNLVACLRLLDQRRNS